MAEKSGSELRRLSAGVIVVRRESARWFFLLLRAYRNWDFPKGMVERDESPLLAAQREVREETTIVDLSFEFGDEFIETGPYSRNKVARYYLARTNTADVSLPVNPDLGVPEHHEWRWVDLDEARDKLSPRLQPVLDWAQTRIAAAA